MKLRVVQPDCQASVPTLTGPQHGGPSQDWRPSPPGKQPSNHPLPFPRHGPHHLLLLACLSCSSTLKELPVVVLAARLRPLCKQPCVRRQPSPCRGSPQKV